MASAFRLCLFEIGRPRRCTVIIVASRADATRGVRPSDFHDPTFCAAARAAAAAGVSFRGLRASHTVAGTTVDAEIPIDLSEPGPETLQALRRAWEACAPITGWDRTFGKDAPKRVANGEFAHNKGRAHCDAAPRPVASPHFTPRASGHFGEEGDAGTPAKKKRRPARGKKASKRA